MSNRHSVLINALAYSQPKAAILAPVVSTYTNFTALSPYLIGVFPVNQLEFQVLVTSPTIHYATDVCLKDVDPLFFRYAFDKSIALDKKFQNSNMQLIARDMKTKHGISEVKFPAPNRGDRGWFDYLRHVTLHSGDLTKSLESLAPIFLDHPYFLSVRIKKGLVGFETEIFDLLLHRNEATRLQAMDTFLDTMHTNQRNWNYWPKVSTPTTYKILGELIHDEAKFNVPMITKALTALKFLLCRQYSTVRESWLTTDSKCLSGIVFCLSKGEPVLQIAACEIIHDMIHGRVASDRTRTRTLLYQLSRAEPKLFEYVFRLLAEARHPRAVSIAMKTARALMEQYGKKQYFAHNLQISEAEAKEFHTKCLSWGIIGSIRSLLEIDCTTATQVITQGGLELPSNNTNRHNYIDVALLRDDECRRWIYSSAGVFATKYPREVAECGGGGYVEYVVAPLLAVTPTSCSGSVTAVSAIVKVVDGLMIMCEAMTRQAAQQDKSSSSPTYYYNARKTSYAEYEALKRIQWGFDEAAAKALNAVVKLCRNFNWESLSGEPHQRFLLASKMVDFFCLREGIAAIRMQNVGVDGDVKSDPPPSRIHNNYNAKRIKKKNDAAQCYAGSTISISSSSSDDDDDADDEIITKLSLTSPAVKKLAYRGDPNNVLQLLEDQMMEYMPTCTPAHQGAASASDTPVLTEAARNRVMSCLHKLSLNTEMFYGELTRATQSIYRDYPDPRMWRMHQSRSV